MRKQILLFLVLLIVGCGNKSGSGVSSGGSSGDSSSDDTSTASLEESTFDDATFE